MLSSFPARIRSEYFGEHQKEVLWKKFEYFSFPTQEVGEMYIKLQEMYENFYGEYLKSNGLEGKPIKDKRDLDLAAILKIHEDTANRTVRKKDNDDRYEKIMSDTDFNIEDKIFLNRMMYLCLKKNEPSFTSFFKRCKILQVETI